MEQPVGRDNWGCWICGGFSESAKYSWCCWLCGLTYKREDRNYYCCISPVGYYSDSKVTHSNTKTVCSWVVPFFYDKTFVGDRLLNSFICIAHPFGVCINEHQINGQDTQTYCFHWFLGGQCRQNAVLNGSHTSGICTMCLLGPLIIRNGRCCEAISCDRACVCSCCCCCCDAVANCCCSKCGQVDMKPYQSTTYTFIPFGSIERIPVLSSPIEAPVPVSLNYSTVIRGPCGQFEF